MGDLKATQLWLYLSTPISRS